MEMQLLFHGCTEDRSLKNATDAVADLIGDIDPIKRSNLKLSYADDRVIHFGMIPLTVAFCN
jgi:hypothetical protein